MFLDFFGDRCDRVIAILTELSTMTDYTEVRGSEREFIYDFNIIV
jgi:hypothetical protein